MLLLQGAGKRGEERRDGETEEGSRRGVEKEKERRMQSARGMHAVAHGTWYITLTAAARS